MRQSLSRGDSIICASLEAFGISRPHHTTLKLLKLLFNRNLKAALAIYHHSQHTRWDENVPSLTIAFNTAWHESTGATPASLFLGRAMNHPRDLKWEFQELEVQQDRKGMCEFWEADLANLKKARARIAARYDVGTSQCTPGGRGGIGGTAHESGTSAAFSPFIK
jgi:hypothetical protein